MSQVYGILGYPVAHSRSPAMHNAAFAALGVDAIYVRFEVEPAQVFAAVAGLRALGIAGANVTVPHKEAVLAALDEVSPAARAIGAVNTIVRREARLIGHNTDAEGLARSLAEAGVRLPGARVTVLGAGGSARAAVVGLAHAGASQIAIAARRIEQAERLCADTRGACASAELTALSLEREPLSRSFARSTLVVQATSATLGAGAEAFAAQLPLDALGAGSAVIDLVYKPLETSVLRRARQLGHLAVEGLGMLLHQGALAFELWTDQRAPIEVMRAALQE